MWKVCFYISCGTAQMLMLAINETDVKQCVMWIDRFCVMLYFQFSNLC